MRKIRNWTGLRILPLVINFYLKTIKLNVHNRPDESKNFIFIFWHSKMLTGWYLFRGKGYAALVSKSKDGEILSNILTKWKYKTIRGSSSKGGREALLELKEKLNNNNSSVLTPDGPRGPSNEIKNGALILSFETGVPIIPVKMVNRKKIILKKSWDKFEIPLPFSRCDVYFGNEHTYNKYLNDDELKNFKYKLSLEM